MSLLSAALATAAFVSPTLRRPALLAAPPARARPVCAEPFSFESFEPDVFRTLMDAQTEARALGSEAVASSHLVLAAALQKDDVAASLRRAGLEQDEMRERLRTSSSGPLPGLERLFAARDELLPFSKCTERALKGSVSASRNGELIEWRELILCVLEDDGADSAAAVLIRSLSLEPSEVRRAVEEGERELVGAGAKRKGTAANSTLAQCSVDLTAKARQGKLDPLIGREPEVCERGFVSMLTYTRH
jgi:ATP-dependent Clp protease ATP-binding subunit ClpA